MNRGSSIFSQLLQFSPCCADKLFTRQHAWAENGILKLLEWNRTTLPTEPFARYSATSPPAPVADGNTTGSLRI